MGLPHALSLRRRRRPTADLTTARLERESNALAQVRRRAAPMVRACGAPETHFGLRQSQGDGDHGGLTLRRRQRALEDPKWTAEARNTAVRRRAAAGKSRPRPRGWTVSEIPTRGGRCFEYRPAPGPSRPSNRGSAARIIRESSPIYLSLFPRPLAWSIPATRRRSPRAAPASPVAAVRRRPLSWLRRRSARVLYTCRCGGSLVDSGSSSPPRPRAPPSPPANLPVTPATVIAELLLSLQLIQSSPFSPASSLLRRERD